MPPAVWARLSEEWSKNHRISNLSAGIDLWSGDLFGVDIVATQEIETLLKSKKPDVLIDFTIAQAAVGNVKVAARNNVAAHCRNNGFTPEQHKEMAAAIENHVPAVISSNFSSRSQYFLAARAGLYCFPGGCYTVPAFWPRPSLPPAFSGWRIGLRLLRKWLLAMANIGSFLARNGKSRVASAGRLNPRRDSEKRLCYGVYPPTSEISLETFPEDSPAPRIYPGSFGPAGGMVGRLDSMDRDQHHQLGIGLLVALALEQIADNRQIAQSWKLSARYWLHGCPAGRRSQNSGHP